MNTVQSFCINDSTWYPIIGRNFSRSLWPSAVLRKQLGKQNLTLSNSRFQNLFIDILLCGGFLENSARANFFWRTPAKVWSKLKDEGENQKIKLFMLRNEIGSLFPNQLLILNGLMNTIVCILNFRTSFFFPITTLSRISQHILQWPGN